MPVPTNVLPCPVGSVFSCLTQGRRLPLLVRCAVMVPERDGQSSCPVLVNTGVNTVTQKLRLWLATLSLTLEASPLGFPPVPLVQGGSQSGNAYEHTTLFCIQGTRTPGASRGYCGYARSNEQKKPYTCMHCFTFWLPNCLYFPTARLDASVRTPGC